ncbi:dTDP-4-dehydrorhamnose 3,5-epimerase [Phenylobacterium sp. J426]|uniref:dTDP-4-dehydrorhamnose 3,5-epimerase n=1 Tax=Phenylobacterium sp. J426 TaxID=2898439 RepID=UPI00215150DA|nr:dTDP-4-dehydrorhamnose 3,5-epimerase [Phenylobacterium sp. J426]MCR5874115.1 dTDP-4-dehydrorhamnose 3,5-epimerase [Phenylobacterium sp. J426]
MTVTPLADLPDVLLITPKRFGDLRGWFSETWSRKAMLAAGVDTDFVQDNQALNAKKGTLRGLHFQKAPHAQGKLVRVLQGAIFDVAVDIRAGSPTYGKWAGATLTAEAGEQLWVPRGFAHGYCTLTDDTMLFYKVDGLYAPETEGGLAWNDPDLAIAWPLDGEPVLSDKDKTLPRLRDLGPVSF